MSASTASTDSCIVKIDLWETQYYSLIPSFLILFVLHGYEYFKHKKIFLQAPFSSLRDNDKNKTLVMFGFGAMASSIFQLLFVSLTKGSSNDMGEIIKSIFMFILKIIVVGTVNYPVFVCISSTKKQIASLLGCMFSLWQLVLILLISVDIDCSKNPDAKGVTITFNLFSKLPSMICWAVLLVYFGRRFYKCTISRENRTMSDSNKHTFANKQQVQYARSVFNKTIFNNHPIAGFPWYKKPLIVCQKIFRSNFQYSTLFSSSMATILIGYYYIGVSLIFGYTTAFKRLNGIMKYDLGFGIPFVVTAIVYVVIILHFLYCHQNTMLSLYRGRMYEMQELSSKTLIRNNILFPGYLVAYMMWGLLVFFAVFLGIYWAVYVFVKRIIESSDFKTEVVQLLKYLFSILFLPFIVYIGQTLSVYFVFTEYKVKVDTMINHIKLYHIVIYFNFFYNIVIGLSSSLKRSFLSLFINLFFMGRIDRTSFVFFSTLDRGYQAYLGFLYVQKIYKNPIMRCFCQFLFDDVQENSNNVLSEQALGEISCESANHRRSRLARKNRVAFNRWFVAITLLNNPSLIALRGGNADQNVGTDNNLIINGDGSSFDYRML